MIAALILIAKGREHNDRLVSAIGYITLAFDSYTFYLTTKRV